MILKEQVVDTLEKILNGKYDLVNVEFLKGSNKNMRIQVMIDKLDETSITHDDCVIVTRMIQEPLDKKITDYFILEVSSPGIDRILNKPSHFIRFIGHKIRFKKDNEKRIEIIKNANNEGIELESGDNILYQDIKDAKLHT